MSNEQWIKGGDCSKCRKLKYCTTECKQRKNRIANSYVALGAQILASMLKRRKDGK